MCVGLCEVCDNLEEDRKELQALAELVKGWNWNATPAEVAKEIKELDESGRWTEDEIIDEMRKQGHSDSDIWAVQDVIDNAL